MEAATAHARFNEALYARVRALLLKNLPAEEALFTPGARFREDLGADSLDMAELAIAIGDEFGVEIPEEVDETLVTIANLVNYLDVQGAR